MPAPARVAVPSTNACVSCGLAVRCADRMGLGRLNRVPHCPWRWPGLYRSNSLAKGMERMRLVRCGLTVLVALLVASAPLHGQTLGAHLPTDPQAPGAAISDASPAPAFDLDRAVAGVLEDQAALLLQRTRTRPARRTSGGGNPTLAWAGVGMLAVGGILAINGAVSTCGVSVSRDFRDVSTSQCWTRAGVGAGVGALGAFLFMKNR